MTPARWIVTAAIMLTAAALMMLFVATRGHAHSWYSPACCSDKDCEPLPVDAVIPLADGAYRVDYESPRLGSIHEVALHHVVQDSLDGGFHVCARPGLIHRILCLYAPLNS